MLDPVYVNIAIGTSVSFFADVTFCTLFPLVVLSLGYSKADSALCISILSAADILGRLCVTLIGALCPRISSRILFFAGAVMSVIGRMGTSLQVHNRFYKIQQNETD
jgi:cyanate permease